MSWSNTREKHPRPDISSFIRMLFEDCEGHIDLGPPPPRVILMPSSRSGPRGQCRSVREYLTGRRFQRDQPSEDQLSAVPHEQQQQLQQYPHLLEHFQECLGKLGSGFRGGVSQYEDDPPPDPFFSPYWSGIGRGGTKGKTPNLYPVSYGPG